MSFFKQSEYNLQDQELAVIKASIDLNDLNDRQTLALANMLEISRQRPEYPLLLPIGSKMIRISKKDIQII